jgi:hypothetical protein
VANCSKTLSRAENYCVNRRKFLAVVKTREHSQKCLCGQDFHMYTDNTVLTWLLISKNLERQTTHWVQRLLEYFTSEYHQRRKNTNADALFRKP